jgi:hypothetical protein
MVGEPSHVKQLSLNHLCKIGLKLLFICRRTRKRISNLCFLNGGQFYNMEKITYTVDRNRYFAKIPVDMALARTS